MGVARRTAGLGTAAPRRARWAPVAAAALVLVLGLAGCSSGSAAPLAAPAEGAVAPAPAAAAAGSASTVVDGLELQVTGFHLLPPVPGDPVVERAADELGVPVEALAQMHLLLTVRNTTGSARSLAGDVLRLGHGPRTAQAAGGPVFPGEPLPAGAQQETAAGFWVAFRAGSGPMVLRWTHGARTAVVPIGGVRESA